MTLYDKKGIPFVLGDVVKVFHFTAALRRKRHYMYKQVIGFGNFERGTPYVQFSHLDLTDEDYKVVAEGQILDDYEIVQSIDCEHDRRARKKARNEQVHEVTAA